MNKTLSIPHDFEGEQAILGSIIISSKALSEVIDVLDAKSFHSESHQHIFRAMLELEEDGKPIDEILLGDKLKSFGKLEEVGSYQYLAELAENAPMDGNLNYYARVIKEHSMLRDLINIAADIERKARDPKQNVSELISEADMKIADLYASDNRGGTQRIKDVIPAWVDELEERSKNPGKIPGVPTGFRYLDRLTGGLTPSDLIIIAGRPGSGKSAFATNIAENVAIEEKIPVIVFSREMSNEQNTGRIISSNSEINNHKIRTGNLQQEDWDGLGMSISKISEAQIYLNGKSDTIRKVVLEIRSFHRKHGKCIAIVDYIQLLEGEGNYREQEIAGISRSLKKVASDLDITVIALSQLNRSLESRSDKRPKLSDLRESGAIEQDANIIIFIYREDIYREDEKGYVPTGIAEIIVSKNRNGPTGTIELQFIGKYTKFANLPVKEYY